jgi:hypothetical protein
MAEVRFEHRHLDVACELDRAEGGARAREWGRLRAVHGLGAAEPIPGGARLWLRAEGLPVAEDLARRESSCCGFLDLEVSTREDRVQLDITSPAPGAAGVIACLAGLEDAGALPCC